MKAEENMCQLSLTNLFRRKDNCRRRARVILVEIGNARARKYSGSRFYTSIDASESIYTSRRGDALGNHAARQTEKLNIPARVRSSRCLNGEIDHVFFRVFSGRYVAFA